MLGRVGDGCICFYASALRAAANRIADATTARSRSYPELPIARLNQGGARSHPQLSRSHGLLSRDNANVSHRGGSIGEMESCTVTDANLPEMYARANVFTRVIAHGHVRGSTSVDVHALRALLVGGVATFARRHPIRTKPRPAAQPARQLRPHSGNTP